MKVVNYLIITIVALLSVAAGLAKIMQTPQEMEFLQGAGLSPALIVAFGLVQVSGGLLLVMKQTRLPGAVLAMSAFVASAVLIFISGNLAFGLFSLLPVALACLIIYLSRIESRNKSLNTDAEAN